MIVLIFFVAKNQSVIEKSFEGKKFVVENTERIIILKFYRLCGCFVFFILINVILSKLF